MSKPLTPADRNRCQADRPNMTWSPMNFGPADVRADGEKVGGSRQVDRMWRCSAEPACIVEESEPGKDGQRGEMSLCVHCFLVLFNEDPTRARLKEELPAARRRAAP